MSRRSAPLSQRFVALPPWGQVILAGKLLAANKQGCFHTKEACVNGHCAYHNPSEHHMRRWPIVLRLDKQGLVERQCPHGIGHADPDSLVWLKTVIDDEDEVFYLAVHNCDGCCSDPYSYNEGKLPASSHNTETGNKEGEQ